MFPDNFYCAGCGARHDHFLTRCRVCKAESVCYDGRGDRQRESEARQQQREAERRQRQVAQEQAQRKEEESRRAQEQAAAQRAVAQREATKVAASKRPSKAKTGPASPGAFSWSIAFLFFLIGTGWAASQPQMGSEGAMAVGAFTGIIVGKYFRQLLTLAVIAGALYVAANS